jgi:type I restriction enzyme S subunit
MPFITIPDMHGKVFVTETSKYLSIKGIQTQSKKTLPVYSICVSCIATPGLVVLTTEPSQTNQQINSLVPSNKFTSFYCYFALRELDEEIKARGSGGTALYNLNKGQFSEIPILIPTLRLITDFQKLIQPLFENLLLNQKQSRSLASIRDTLLPKLLSGEIRVKEVKKVLEALT